MSAIGEQTMDRILDVTDELQACMHEKFEPYEGVFRLNESGEYVSENDWLNVWGGRPTWWHKAWMLADNGQYTTSAVAAMSVAEIERATMIRASSRSTPSTPRSMATAYRSDARMQCQICGSR